MNGFSIQANSYIERGNREDRERLFRYMARPPLSNDRLSLDENGDIIWSLKNIFSDGTHSLRFSPIELVEKIASIIPPPWKNLTKYFGVFAPNAKIRKYIVPEQNNATQDLATNLSPRKSYYIPWADLLKRTFKSDFAACEHCGGKLKFISAIFDLDAIQKILKCLNSSTGPPTSPQIPSQSYEYEIEYHPS